MLSCSQLLSFQQRESSMTSVTATLLPMLFLGLLLSGCSGLDDPDDGGDDRVPSDYDGAYILTVTPPVDDSRACTDADGVMRLNDGKVTGEATDNNTGDTFILSGTVESDGFISGSLVSSFSGGGSYSGLMRTTCSDTSCSGTGGDGTWRSICVEEWAATK